MAALTPATAFPFAGTARPHSAHLALMHTARVPMRFVRRATTFIVLAAVVLALAVAGASADDVTTTAGK